MLSLTLGCAEHLQTSEIEKKKHLQELFLKINICLFE